MIRLYCAALIGGAFFLSYFVGGHIANVKCNERAANANVERMMDNTKIIEETNETVFHTSVGDIRSILREKYTIAE